MSATVLLTGFGSFAGADRNPSEEVAEALQGVSVAGKEVRSVVLPVSTTRVDALVERAMADIQPEVVIGLGVTPGRPALALERVAINVRDFPIPDVDGDQPVDEPIRHGGAAAYFTSLPVKAILQAWRDRDLPGYVSNTAGTYVCNQVFYQLAEATSSDRRPCGLIHLPSAPSAALPVVSPGVPGPSMAVELMVEAVQLAIEVTIDHHGADALLAAGALG